MGVYREAQKDEFDNLTSFIGDILEKFSQVNSDSHDRLAHG